MIARDVIDTLPISRNVRDWAFSPAGFVRTHPTWWHSDDEQVGLAPEVLAGDGEQQVEGCRCRVRGRIAELRRRLL